MSHTYHGDGHCRHAPKCMGIGDPDDRDPFGCCNCGTREAGQHPGISARQQGGGKDMSSHNNPDCRCTEPSQACVSEPMAMGGIEPVTPVAPATLGATKTYRKKPITVAVAKVLGGVYHCRNPQRVKVAATADEYVVNPGTEDEYPITRERLAELYEEV